MPRTSRALPRTSAGDSHDGLVVSVVGGSEEGTLNTPGASARTSENEYKSTCFFSLCSCAIVDSTLDGPGGWYKYMSTRYHRSGMVWDRSCELWEAKHRVIGEAQSHTTTSGPSLSRRRHGKPFQVQIKSNKSKNLSYFNINITSYPHSLT